MRLLDYASSIRLIALAAILLAAAAAPVHADDDNMTRLNIQVKSQSGKPVERASVIVKFVQGRSIIKLGKKVRTTFELRTNQEGEARFPSIPQGQILIQFIAKEYQTFGQVFEVNEQEKVIPITLNPPQ